METYLVPMWVVECGVQRDGCISMVKAADAQATVEALQAIIKQMGEQAAVLAKDGMAAKAQVEALQRERDEAVLLRDHNLRRCDVLDSKYKKGLAAVKVLQSQLSQLQALVRALPVPEEGGFPIVEVDGDYYVNHTSRFSTKAEADAYTGLLIYRATLDATTPAADTSIIGKCEPPSQWNQNAQVRGDIS